MEKNMKFEEAMASLEDITRRLESGNLPLEDAISAYERAVALIKICNEKLEAAEKKVKILTKSADGSVIAADFVGQDAN